MDTNKILIELRNTPFMYGGHSLDQGGLDCIGFVIAFYEKMGIMLPTEFKGMTLDNYFKIYAESDDKDGLLIDYMNIVGVEIDNIKNILKNDFLALRLGKSNLFPAIYGGNKIVISTFINSKVKTFPLTKAFTVVKARRII